MERSSKTDPSFLFFLLSQRNLHKISGKAFEKDSSLISFIPNEFETKETCEVAFQKILFLIKFITDEFVISNLITEIIKAKRNPK